jgi:hypothetical protein
VWNWSDGSGDRSEMESEPLEYWIAWPGSVELPVGAKMRFGVGLMVPDSGWPSGEIGFW